jgi:hypothetical protein
MPAIYAQHALRQTAPSVVAAAERSTKPVPLRKRAKPPNSGRQMSDRVKALPALWANPELSGEQIATMLGFPSRKAVYVAAHRLGLPYRCTRTRKSIRDRQ